MGEDNQLDIKGILYVKFYLILSISHDSISLRLSYKIKCLLSLNTTTNPDLAESNT